jgi:hypothetical protein
MALPEDFPSNPRAYLIILMRCRAIDCGGQSMIVDRVSSDFPSNAKSSPDHAILTDPGIII